MGSNSVTPLAAIRFTPEDGIDDLLESVVRALQSEGVSVCGFLQRESQDPNACCNISHLEDVSDGTWHRISQALGSGSKGCRLDPRALADASGLLLARLEAGTEFLVLNRFGKGESEGQGFRSVIERAFELGIPVLTAVREAYQPAWSEFTDGSAQLLSPDKAAALAWAKAALQEARLTCSVG